MAGAGAVLFRAPEQCFLKRIRGKKQKEKERKEKRKIYKEQVKEKKNSFKKS